MCNLLSPSYIYIPCPTKKNFNQTCLTHFPYNAIGHVKPQSVIVGHCVWPYENCYFNRWFSLKLQGIQSSFSFKNTKNSKWIFLEKYEEFVVQFPWKYEEFKVHFPWKIRGIQNVLEKYKEFKVHSKWIFILKYEEFKADFPSKIQGIIQSSFSFKNMGNYSKWISPKNTRNYAKFIFL